MNKYGIIYFNHPNPTRWVGCSKNHPASFNCDDKAWEFSQKLSIKISEGAFQARELKSIPKSKWVGLYTKDKYYNFCVESPDSIKNIICLPKEF